MEITQILLNAQSPDGSIRKVAEESLRHLQEQSMPDFLVSLSRELANDDKPQDSRKLAGLILKNSLDAKEASRKLELAQSWRSLDPMVKVHIKAALMQTLASSAVDACHTSAQVIAKVAAIELPQGEWPELVGSLLSNMGGPRADRSPSLLKQVTLETLGYVCEEVPSDVLVQDQVNSILTAVVQGMNDAEVNSEVRLAATKALNNALDFAHTNFQNVMERDYLMRMVGEATQSSDVRVRRAAFECLVSISSTYYEKLAPYMKDFLAITAKAVTHDEEEVAVQAIEFWSSICDEEIDMQEEYGEFQGDSEVENFYIIKQALPVLVPLLLETLTKQDEDENQEDEAWNLSMAGGTCLGLVARTVSDNIVPLVTPFIQENVSKSDWRCREAATYAFGSILEGPSLETLAPLVNSAFNFILNALKDENNHVKDTAAWSLGRVFEFLHGPNIETPLISQSSLPFVLSVLLESIKDAPNVAGKVCGAIYYLAQGYEEPGGNSSYLSPFIQNIVQALLTTAEREDADESRLRTSAYETLNVVIRCSSQGTIPIVIQLVPIIMQKLHQTLDMQILSVEDREKQSEQQALLCGVLQVIIQKLGSSDSTKIAILQHADQMMSLFLRVLACRSATVHEEAMLVIGSLAYATGPEFEKYMDQLIQYLVMGLQNHEEYQVCSVTVGVVGDICRALDKRVLNYCDKIMSELLKDLSSTQLHRSVKPLIFSCFGDIALAIGEHFEKYLAYAMLMLQAAAELSVQVVGRDDEIIDYTNQLRSGILEAYSGIFQGFKGTKAEMLLPYAGNILQFLGIVYQDKDRDDAVTKAAVGVLGDFADTMGIGAAALLQQSVFYKDFLDECISSSDLQLKGTAEWAQLTLSHCIPG